MIPPRVVRSHTTPTTEAEAVAIQRRLRSLAVYDSSGPGPGEPGTVVGVDVAYDDARNLVAAAAVALHAITLEVVERATAVGPVAFPCVPGLLAFRELPAVLDALGRLRRAPDLVVCDGYGLAHPRLPQTSSGRCPQPTIGVAKNPFTFAHTQPPPHRGAFTPLLDGDEEVGRALRTRDGVKPVYVSPGHRTTLDDACAHTLHLTRGVRLPETTRAADRLCREALAAA